MIDHIWWLLPFTFYLGVGFGVSEAIRIGGAKQAGQGAYLVGLILWPLVLRNVAKVKKGLTIKKR